jgi:hypothetical protein
MHFLEQFEGIQVINEEHLNVTEEVRLSIYCFLTNSKDKPAQIRTR